MIENTKKWNSHNMSLSLSQNIYRIETESEKIRILKVEVEDSQE